MTETQSKSSRDEDSASPGSARRGPEQPSSRGGEGDRDSLLEIAPALARLAAAAWWRVAERTVEESLRTGARLLGLTGGDEDRREPGQRAPAERERSASTRARRGPSLRERGEELLRRSADVDYDEDPHPAYARILDVLAPDEARILRLLAQEGPQVAVDVRTSRPFNIGSRLVAPGLSMIGAGAGCRYTDRVHAYLNNLNRLGLIWFSREPVEEQLRYQVLEAQPEVVEALREAGRGRTVRRSIHLTPFGEDFCDAILPIHTDELEALSGDEVAAGGEVPSGAEAPATRIPEEGEEDR